MKQHGCLPFRAWNQIHVKLSGGCPYIAIIWRSQMIQRHDSIRWRQRPGDARRDIVIKSVTLDGLNFAQRGILAAYKDEDFSKALSRGPASAPD
jgi:hypothetical protein